MSIILHPESVSRSPPQLFIPTNLEVSDEVRKNFAAFYAELFDRHAGSRNGKAVVTEYAVANLVHANPCPLRRCRRPIWRRWAPDVATPRRSAMQGRRARGLRQLASWVLTGFIRVTKGDALRRSDYFSRGQADDRGAGQLQRSAGENGGDAGAQESSENNFRAATYPPLLVGSVKCDHPTTSQWAGRLTDRACAHRRQGSASAPRGKSTSSSRCSRRCDFGHRRQASDRESK